MTIRLTLPQNTNVTSAYTEAKATGGLLSLDALQRRYSPNFKPEGLYAAKLPGIDILPSVKDPVPMLGRALEQHMPELVEMVLNQFPDLEISEHYAATDWFCRAMLNCDSPTSVRLVMSRVKMSAKARLGLGGLDQSLKNKEGEYGAAWAQSVGFCPTGRAKQYSPACLLSVDVFKAVRAATLPEEFVSIQRAEFAAFIAAALFDNVQDVARFYDAYATVNTTRRLTDSLQSFFMECEADMPNVYVMSNLRAVAREKLWALQKAADRKPSERRWLPPQSAGP